MTAPTRELLEAFDRLSEPERRELAFEILRRTSDQELPPLGDEELTSAAEELFLELDAWERPMPAPSRGEVWLVDLGYAAKVRPCLVLSVPAQEQDRALATVVAHTTSPRGSRFEVAISTNFLKPGAFDAQNLVTIPHAKLIRKFGTLAGGDLVTVEGEVRSWLGL